MQTHRMRSIALLFILYFAAFWPVVSWYVSRLSDSSETAFHLIPLLSVLLYAFGRKPASDLDSPSLGFAAGVIAVYCASFHHVPPMVKAGFALMVLFLVLRAIYSKETIQSTALFLLMFSLPIIPTLQFYCGYPMRLLATHFAYPFILLCGHDIVIEGTSYFYEGRLVSIDAPCSGITMLWIGFYLFFSTALFFRMKSMRTIILSLLVFPLIIMGNIIRITNLFYLQFAGIQVPDWLHYGTGSIVFLVICLLIFWMTNKYREGTVCDRSLSTSSVA